MIDLPAPWERLFGKQLDIFNSRARILLVSGSRKSGKTFGLLERIVRHMWETPGARVGVFAKSKGLAKEFGSWQDLTEKHVPGWIGIESALDPKIIFEITTVNSEGVPGVKQDGQTRTAFFRVRNMYGGESEARLFSIEHDHEVEAKVKNKVFSLIYFIELSNFQDKRILTVTLQQLRMDHLRPKDGKQDVMHQWAGDTNPDVELGNRSWIYKTFYVDRNKKDMTEKEKMFYGSMQVIELFHGENPHITQQEIVELEISCEDDPALNDSYVKGIWGDGAQQRGKLLAPWFIRNFHVVGGGEGEGDQIDVRPGTVMLWGGWDLGNVNHAVVLLDMWFVNISGVDRRHWAVLDEKWTINEKIDLVDFTHDIVEKMDHLNTINKKTYDWKHWSDIDAIKLWNPSAAAYDYQIVQAASHGKIVLQGVAKPEGSVRSRVWILKRLLKEKRLFISARCTRTIEMIENLRRGDGKDYVHQDEYKHLFDCLTYPLLMESEVEMLEESMSRPSASERQAPTLVSVG